MQEVPFHKSNKKEAGETDEESKKADDAGKEVLEVEVPKHEYSRAVSITDSKKDHANMFTDKEHEKKDDEGDLNIRLIAMLLADNNFKEAKNKLHHILQKDTKTAKRLFEIYPQAKEIKEIVDIIALYKG